MENFKDKVVVISGGCGGVGRELIDYFSSKNALCISIDCVNAPLSKKKNQIYLFSDLSNSISVKSAIQKIEKLTEKVDLLVNAAGIFIEDKNCNENDIIELWKNNFMTAYFLSLELLPFLKKASNPQVINISSTDSIVANSGQNCEIGTSHDIVYASTKGAINTLTKCLAMKWACNNIRVNSICPTIIRTPMCDSLLSVGLKEKELISYIPLKRICEPIDIAEAVEMLYNMKMTTGHILTVDGGYLCQ
jgi:dihydroanticapsin dehydrogenase